MLRVDTERRFLPRFKNRGLAPSNVSIIPVHPPVLNGFAQVCGGNVLLPRQIRDRPGDLERTVIDVDAVEERAWDFRIIPAALGLGAFGVPVRRAAEDVFTSLRCQVTI